MQLSDHFSLEELIVSQEAERRGIDNMPSAAIIDHLRLLVGTLERVRTLLGAPILISSGYRCPALNAAVGGSVRSAHMDGLAADFISPRVGTPVAVCKAIAASDLPFDQLIYEHTWCHLGLALQGHKRELLTYDPATRGYLKGIVG